MAKYLEDELKSNEIKHCDTCKCSNKDLTVLIDEPKTYNVGTQTIIQGENNSSLCLRCNSNLNSPSRTNSPYIMKLVKSSDSVISETKSSVSDFNDADKLFTPAKKDDLMVNPILGHHRLCDRTININKHLLQSSSLSILAVTQATNNANSNTNINMNTITNINNYQLNNNSNNTAKYLIENHQHNINNNKNINNSNSNKNNDDNNEHDLIDLNKFNSNTNTNISITPNHKSPKMAVNNDITSNSNSNNNNSSNYRIQQLGDNKLINNTINTNANANNSNNSNSTSQKSDSNNLLIDTIENGNEIVQGNHNTNNNNMKIDNIMENNEKKTANNNIGNGSNLFDTKINLQKTSITGSTNSLWSKTSSTEGAKIFENFNRNLIKTIKVSIN